MTPHPHILGVILAGGEARRMGGGDKGLAELAGQPMLAHVIQRFAPQVDRLILNANGERERLAAFGLEVVADTEAPGEGPLAGLLTAMEWAEASGYGYKAIATVTTDVPFLPGDLVARLAAAHTSGPVVAQSGGRVHPCIGLWPLSLKGAVRAALETERRSVEAFALANGAIAVPFPFGDSGNPTIDPFFNANTPDDLATARKLLAGQT
jgi:molybdenum cofactor guanylyltransferase